MEIPADGVLYRAGGERQTLAVAARGVGIRTNGGPRRLCQRGPRPQGMYGEHGNVKEDFVEEAVQVFAVRAVVGWSVARRRVDRRDVDCSDAGRGRGLVGRGA